MTEFIIMQSEYILRIVIAGMLGFLIGLERRNRSKDAGVRTHCVVACATALMMLVSKYGFFDLITQYKHLGADIRLDPSRVASTIVSGIGFLGAGMIYVHKNSVTGLTTAAGIFATAGIGMAIGAGMYAVGVAATIILLVVQFLLHLKTKSKSHANASTLVIKGVDESGFLSAFKDMLSQKNIILLETEISKDTKGKFTYSFIVDLPDDIGQEDVLNLTQYECSIY